MHEQQCSCRLRRRTAAKIKKEKPEENRWYVLVSAEWGIVGADVKVWEYSYGVRLQAKHSSKNPTGLPVGVVRS